MTTSVLTQSGLESTQRFSFLYVSVNPDLDRSNVAGTTSLLEEGICWRKGQLNQIFFIQV